MQESEGVRAKDFVRMEEILERTGFCRKTIVNLIKRDEFPKGRKIGRAVVWPRSKIDEWLTKQS